MRTVPSLAPTMSWPFVVSLLSLSIWLGLLCLRGGFWRVRLPAAAAPPTDWPAVVAVVPARNEAEVVAEAVTSLLTQAYSGEFRVILVDDHSDDGTAALARAAAAACGREDRLHIVSAQPLPPGWSGKVWAQQQGVEAVAALLPDAEYVWLTDADIGHPPAALAGLVALARAEGRDLVSEMVRLRTASPAERLLIPAFVFFFAKLYPFQWVADARKRTAGAAGGCLLVRRAALDRIGQMRAIHDALIDDCALAAALKRHGPIRLDLSRAAVSLRPYDGWRPIWDMIARTAYTQLHYSRWALAGTVLAMTLTYLVPPVLTVTGALSGAIWTWPAALAWILMVCAYRPTLRYYGQAGLLAWLLPGVALFYLGATLDSARRHWLGRGGQWKGRAQGTATQQARPRR